MRAPAASTCLCGSRPLNDGNSDGWMFKIRPRHLRTNLPDNKNSTSIDNTKSMRSCETEVSLNIRRPVQLSNVYECISFYVYYVLMYVGYRHKTHLRVSAWSRQDTRAVRCVAAGARACSRQTLPVLRSACDLQPSPSPHYTRCDVLSND